MQLSNPIFLWALAGLAVPIGIHLLSRKEGQVIRLGSLRHLQETSTQQFRGIRLNEILLLTLRCLLIILFALLLSGLHWNSSPSNRWVLIEKGLENQAHLKSALDSLNKDGYESRWLAEGFPLIKDSSRIKPLSNYREIVRQLETVNNSKVIVFAMNRSVAFRGERIILPENIHWISQPATSSQFLLQKIQVSNDSALVRTGHSNKGETNFTDEKIVSPSEGATPMENLSVSVVSDKSHTYDHKIMKAVLNAVSQSFPVKMNVIDINSSTLLSTSSDWIIWLSDEEIPKSATKLLALKPQPSNKLIISSTSNRWIITKRLTEEVALRGNLTLGIAALLLPGRDQLEEVASLNDRRMMPDSIVWSPETQPTRLRSAALIQEPADKYLLLLFLIVLLTERIIAYNRNQ